MSSATHSRAAEVFKAALGTEGAARIALLDSQCAGDADLRQEVESLLAADERAEAFLATPPAAVHALAAADADVLVGQTVGSYRILRRIASGGMGTVYEASDERLGRTVALKVVRGGPAFESALRRFEHEAKLLARLRHPAIAQIYDVGSHPMPGGSVPFFAMEYVPNARTILEHARERALPIRHRLELFAQVCDAVQYGHQRGVIHRDLKPSNILVGDEALVKIIDFGVGRLVDPDQALTSVHTAYGQIVGTLQYMSPEQCGADPHDLDSRSDIYSLGMVLFELLAGRSPYSVARMSLLAAGRAIREDAPPHLGDFDRTLRSDPDTIVRKALEKDRGRRYQSAGEMSRDLRHYLAGEPIEAKRDSLGYVLRKQLSRHRIAVAVVLGFVLLVAGGLVTSLALWYRAERARQLADQRADELEQVATFQEGQLSGIDARTMGVRLRASLLAKARAAAERSMQSPEEADSRVKDLEGLIAGSDFTGIAREALDQNVFRRALAAIEEKFGDQPLVKARLLHTVSSTLRKLGLLDAAREPQEQALAIRRSMLGDEHPDTLSSITNLGTLLQVQGELSEAEGYFRESLETARRALGDEHRETLGAMNNLGLVLQLQGKFTEAEPYCREALERHRRVLGDEHPDTIASINNMGILLETQGKLAQAEPYYREALEKFRRVNGEEHPDTLVALSNMGFLLQAQGNLSEAEGYYRESMDNSRRVLGDDHPNTLGSINNLGVLLQTQGRLAEAERYGREVLGTARRVLGDEHPDVLRYLNNLGVLLRAQGKFTEAEPYCREALAKFRLAQGDDHPDTLTLINNMGMLLQLQGKLEEAEPYCREALERRRRVRGDEHADTLVSIVNMAGLILALGKPADAVELLVPAESAARREFTGGNAVKLARFLTTFGRARAAVADFESAQTHLSEAHAILSEATGVLERDRTEALNGFIKLYDAWHAAEPDRGYDVKAAEWRAKRGSTTSTE